MRLRRSNGMAYPFIRAFDSRGIIVASALPPRRDVNRLGLFFCNCFNVLHRERGFADGFFRLGGLCCISRLAWQIAFRGRLECLLSPRDDLLCFWHGRRSALVVSAASASVALPFSPSRRHIICDVPWRFRQNSADCVAGQRATE